MSSSSPPAPTSSPTPAKPPTSPAPPSHHPSPPTTLPPLLLPPAHLTTPPTLIAHGAEALLYRTTFLLPPSLGGLPAALKHRPSKPYRHPTLDARLTKHRILSEARALVRARREGVSVPGVLALGAEEGWMLVEWVEGVVVREVLGEWARRWVGREGEEQAGGVQALKALLGRMGRELGRLHGAGIVHGDLTTSNMILRPPFPLPTIPSLNALTANEQEVDKLAGDVVLIDFGLAAQSVQDEDRAVDLYVLERAFGSTHPRVEEWFGEVLGGYRDGFGGARGVLAKLEEVRLRGRKRSMIG
ncbi:MAG: serine/threonine-protein kinase bud32 [Vezdaea acicularis]|nr:MAG: serine/threonine-protein kinase bud32 [Vezdaea acicularis]